jgi:hypothetical protein
MFYLNLDLSQLAHVGDVAKEVIDAAMDEAGRRLTTATHGHILEEVQKKLHSSRQKYIDALSYKQIGKDSWSIDLDPSAFFIEDGLPSNWEMIDALLGQGRPNKSRLEGTPKGQVKTSKEGNKYRAIPFEHNKGQTAQTPFQTSLTNMVKGEMKARKIPYGGIEKDAMGAPKIGLLHSFDVSSRGKGIVPTSKTGNSLLAGVRVYQREVKDRQGKSTVKKAVLTFRMVSEKQKGSGSWIHPGLEGRKFIDDAYDWALKEWETKIGPEIAQEIINGL